MGNTILSLLVSLGLNSKPLDKDLADAERKSLQSVTKIGQGMQKTGLAMTAAISVPITAAALKFVSSASNMAESVSKVNVVFGTSAKGILDWSKTAANSMGMSSQKALEAAGTYGNLFQAMGLTVGPAEEMSKSVVQLAADLASFNNASPDEVLLALRSGLSGEMEPLKKFGVAMNEAALSSMAMTMGLGDNIQALSEAEKMQVRYAVIMGQTTMAQGDFARTAEGMANQSRIVKAKIDDLSASMGEKLLPVALKIVTWASDVIDKFGNMSSESQNFAIAIGGILAVSGPLLTFFGTILTVGPKVVTAFRAIWTAATGPVGLAVIALAGLAIGLKEGADAMGELNTEGGYWIDVGGKVSTTTDNAATSVAGVATAVANVKEEWGRAGDDSDIFTRAVKNQAAAMEASAQAAINAAAATDNYYSAVIGMVPQIQSLKEQLKEARVVYQNLLMNEPYNTEGLEAAKTKVEELEGAVEAQTQGFITNMLIQKLSIGGLTEAEGEFILDYMESTGQIDAETRKQASYIMRVSDELEKLQSRKVFIDVYYAYYSEDHRKSDEFEKHNYATGGFIPTGGWGTVGDSLTGMRTGYEETIHAVPGGVEVFANGGANAGQSNVIKLDDGYMGPSADDIGSSVAKALMQSGAI